ncbi:MAG: hypothetical protein WDN48_18535 [Pseudolabrys sp.]
MLGLPGFKRGRRFVALRGSPKYLAFYEAHNDAVFRSENYLTLIKNPRSQQPPLHHALSEHNPTVARMTASMGEGEGSMLLVLPLTPQPGQEQALRQVLVTDVMPRLLAAPGIIASRLIERDVNAQGAVAQRPRPPRRPYARLGAVG